MFKSPNRFINKHILITALNWGLGHATRCIPLIRELQNIGAQISLATDGRALQLWREEFKDLEIFELPAYKIRYPTSNMAWNIFWQGPKILRATSKEHHWLRRQFQKHAYDYIISDNRFGCYHHQAHNIFITHQLNIQTPWRWSSKAVNLINHYFIRRFDECWVPDFEFKENLSGDLSHGENLKKVTLPPIHYLGPLSRFSTRSTHLPYSSPSYTALAILSGPEPQRSLLEQELLRNMKRQKGQFILVQGKTESFHQYSEKNVKIVSFMTSDLLFQAIQQSNWIICRSGYSSIMDLDTLQKKAILIPTPGQTEQEYLANYLNERKEFVMMKQGSVDLSILEG